MRMRTQKFSTLKENLFLLLFLFPIFLVGCACTCNPDGTVKGPTCTETDKIECQKKAQPPSSSCYLTNVSINTANNTGCCPSNPLYVPPVVNPAMICVDTSAAFFATVDSPCVPEGNVSWSVTEGDSYVYLLQSQGRYMKVKGRSSETGNVNFKVSATGSTVSGYSVTSDNVNTSVGAFKAPTIDLHVIITVDSNGIPAIGTGTSASDITTSAREGTDGIDHDIDRTNQIWQQCCVRFNIKKVDVVFSSKDSSGYDLTNPVSDYEKTYLANLYHGSQDTMVEIYYAKNMGEGQFGWDWVDTFNGKETGIIVAVEEIQKKELKRWQVVAHELGHLVGGLDHASDGVELMVDGYTTVAVKPATPLDLDFGECGKTRTHYKKYTD